MVSLVWEIARGLMHMPRGVGDGKESLNFPRKHAPPWSLSFCRDHTHSPSELGSNSSCEYDWALLW